MKIFLYILVNILIILTSFFIILYKREKKVENIVYEIAKSQNIIEQTSLVKIDGDSLIQESEYCFDLYISIGDCSACLLKLDSIIKTIESVPYSKVIYMYIVHDNFSEAKTFFDIYYRENKKIKIIPYYISRNDLNPILTPKIIVYHENMPFIGTYISSNDNRIEKKFLKLLKQLKRS